MSQLARPSGPMAILAPARDNIAAVLPKGENVERYLRSACFALTRNPALRGCSPQSIIEAVSTGAELGLDFAPALGLCYLIPYGDKCTFLIGYRGLAHLAMRSGNIVKIEAELVFEKDVFIRTMGTNARLEHVPPPLGEPRGKLVGAYAIATFSNGQTQFCVMDRIELDSIRARAKSQDGPWKTDTGEMYRKTPIRRLCKSLNLNSPEMARALGVDGELDIVSDSPAALPAPQPQPPTRTEQMKAALTPQQTDFSTSGPIPAFPGELGDTI